MTREFGRHIAPRMMRRARGRGAAMVEAGFLAPIFVMFWMMMMQVSGTYQYKILSTQETRYQAFYMAVHDCKAMGVPASAPVTSQLGSNTSTQNNVNNDQPPADNKGIMNGLMGGFNAIASKLSLMADVKAQATWDNKTKGGVGFPLLPSNVTSESIVICSPGKGPPDQKSPSIPSLN
jgi:hypothetical protein